MAHQTRAHSYHGSLIILLLTRALSLLRCSAVSCVLTSAALGRLVRPIDTRLVSATTSMMSLTSEESVYLRRRQCDRLRPMCGACARVYGDR